MAVILRPERWTRQPTGPVDVDWSNPLARNLKAAFIGGLTGNRVYEAITRTLSNTNAGVVSVTGVGLADQYSSSAITAQFDTAFGMPQNNAAIFVKFYWNGSTYANQHGCLVKVGNASTGYGIGFGTATSSSMWDSATDFTGAYLSGLYEAVAWKGNSTVSLSPNVDISALFYINSNNTGGIYAPRIGGYTWGASTPVTPSGNVYIGGYTTNRYPSNSPFFHVSFLWNRIPSNEETDELHRNPWQIFRPLNRRIWVGPSVAATYQYARPGSDVSAGAWAPSSGTDLYAMLNDVTPNDSTYIYTQTLDSNYEPLLVWDEAFSDPGVSTEHVLKVRVGAGGIPSGKSLVTTLMQGASQIAQFTDAGPISANTTVEHTLSGAEADSITNYNDLRPDAKITSP